MSVRQNSLGKATSLPYESKVEEATLATSEARLDKVDLSEPAYVVDHQAERALCRKFDFRILPVLSIMYLFDTLDKGNLGNAKTDGLERDLGFTGNQYSIILSCFYIPYVLAAPPFVSRSGRKGESEG